MCQEEKKYVKCFLTINVTAVTLIDVCKLMMVSGGTGWGGPSKYSATSEIWTGTEWRFALGKLPYTARDVRAAFIDNRILYLGIKTRLKEISLNICGTYLTFKRWI